MKAWIEFLSLATALLVDPPSTLRSKMLLPTSYPRALLTASLMVPLMVPRVLEKLSRRWADVHSEQAETEDQAHDDLPDEEEPFDSDAEARKNEEIIQRRLDKLTEVAETIMSNLQEIARDHILLCRSDFQFRSANPDPNVPKGTGANVPHMNETFGPDHKALEGFDEYEDSLKVALVDEMTSLQKKADLAKDTPVPSILQKEKAKDMELEVARLAGAAKGSGKGVPGATAKPKPRPRNKSPNFLDSPAIEPKWRTK